MWSYSRGDRGVESSFETWDYQYREFGTMSLDKADVCLHDSLQVEGAGVTARENAVRNNTWSRCDVPEVLRSPVGADSDNEDGGPSSFLCRALFLLSPEKA